VGKIPVHIFLLSIEGTTPIVIFIEFPIVKLEDILLNYMLEQTWEDISTNGASESFHDC
jgi:hypothetical protein